MKNSCNAVLLVLFLALFANAQEAPLPLSNDSSLVQAPDSSLAIAPDTSLAVAKESSSSIAIVQKSSSSIAMAFKSEKPDYQKNLRNVVYLNPLALFFGAANNMFMFSSAVEIPLNLGNSVIVQPVVWLGSSNGYISLDDVEYEKLVRIGSGIGMRRYAHNKGQGFYLQAIASAYYISAESISHKETPDDDYSGREKIRSWIKVQGMIGDLILYVGAAHKWQNISFFYEGGAGFGYDGTDTYQIGYINKLVFSFNVGLGIPF